MDTRRLNALERALHRATLAKPDKIITPKELESLASDASARLAAVNFLLGTGLFVLLKGDKSELSYRAITQDQLTAKKGLNADETLVLDRIRAAGSEGIWTKHIKAKTQLHQTVVDRCLKSLTQKRMIKTVPDVQHPTRRIYMLENLQPALALTGGPWYTDKELDTEFIKLLSDVCLKFIREKSFPRVKGGRDDRGKRLYPLSYASYATSQQVLAFLQNSKVTETVLTVEHVEMLLNVLVLDGKIEKLPAFRIPIPSNGDSTDGESADERILPRHVSTKRKRVARISSDDPDETGRKRVRSAGRHSDRASHRSISEESESIGDVAHGGDALKLKNEDHSVSVSSAMDKVARFSSLVFSGRRSISEDRLYAGGVVYRAIHEERIPSLGTDQVPCERCPTFAFCRPDGPVSPGECVYYDSWLAVGTVGALSA
ncbi:RNA polymerase Rpc34 subunit-domain-containing protein [Trametes meyenii]|nr:RNA polymerase Rpc34 subunit-domain-containing protein [Trametes meyenii]